MTAPLRTFILHWTDGKDETVSGSGDDQEAALQNAWDGAGHKVNDLPSLDYWEEVTKPDVNPDLISEDRPNG